MATNPAGLVVALLAVCCTAVYQIWAGAKQKELGAGSMQLMHQFAPHATGLLAGLVVGVEPLGLPSSAGGGCAQDENPCQTLHHIPLLLPCSVATSLLVGPSVGTQTLGLPGSPGGRCA